MIACNVTNLRDGPKLDGFKRIDWTYFSRSCHVAVFLSPLFLDIEAWLNTLVWPRTRVTPFGVAEDTGAARERTPDSPSELYPPEGEGEREGGVITKAERDERADGR